MSSGVVKGNKIFLSAIAGELNGISLAFTIFVSSSLIKRALFSLMRLAGGLAGSRKSIKGGL